MTSLNVLAVGRDVAGRLLLTRVSSCSTMCFRAAAHNGSCRLLSRAAANAHPSWKRAARFHYYSVFQVMQSLGENEVEIFSFSIPSLLFSLCYWKRREHSENKHCPFWRVKIAFKSNCKEYFTFLPLLAFFNCKIHVIAWAEIKKY